MAAELRNTICAPHCGNHPCELQVEVRDGRPAGLKAHPHLRFPPCIKGFQLIDRLYHPDRILHPMKRDGARGSGDWKRISWEEALDRVAEGLERAKARHGNRSVALYNYVGQHTLPGGMKAAKVTIHRLLNLWGGFIPAIERGDLCWGAYVQASASLYGSWHVSFPPDEGCDVVIVWGYNPLETGVRGPAQSLKRAKRRGAKIVVVDPVRSLTAQRLGDLHLPIRPGTDVPLALALLNELFRRGSADETFLKLHTNAPFLVREDTGKFLREGDLIGGGSDAFLVLAEGEGPLVPVPPNSEDSKGSGGPTDVEPSLTASLSVKGVPCRTAYLRLRDAAGAWPAERAASVCGISADSIRELATLFGAARVAKVKVSQGGYQRNRAGEDAVQAVGLLNVVTGRVRGMVTPSHAKPPSREEDPAGLRRFYALGISDTAVRHYAVPNPVKDRFPVNRLAEAVLNAETYGTDLRALLVMWGNPVSQNPDGEKTIRALKALDFVMVSDLFMTPTARYADVFLPVSTLMERTCIIEAGEVAPTHIQDLLHLNPKRQLFFSRRAVEPLGESRDDFEIICDLARRMGFGAHFPWRTADDWVEEIVGLARGDSRFPWLQDVTMERLEKEGVVDLDLPPLEATWDLETPSGRIQVYSEGPLSRGESPLPRFGGDGGAASPSSAGQAAAYPLTLLSPKTIFRAHSSFANHPNLLRLGYNRALIHPGDALSRGIRDGDVARVFNDRGETQIEVQVTEDTRPGTIRIYSGGSPELGAANFLTTDRVTGPSESAAYNDCRVEVEKTD
ncbi:MAG: molybdopterin-dependent oxidoreductase [Nitrospinota bacterium]